MTVFFEDYLTTWYAQRDEGGIAVQLKYVDVNEIFLTVSLYVNAST